MNRIKIQLIKGINPFMMDSYYQYMDNKNGLSNGGGIDQPNEFPHLKTSCKSCYRSFSIAPVMADPFRKLRAKEVIQ